MRGLGRGPLLGLRPISLLRFLDSISRKFPLGLGIPSLRIKTMLESNPLENKSSVRRLAAGVGGWGVGRCAGWGARGPSAAPSDGTEGMGELIVDPCVEERLQRGA